MVRYSFLHQNSQGCKCSTAILAFSWTMGLAVGLCAIVSGCCDAIFYQAADITPTFFSIISVLLLPIMIAVLAVFIGQCWLIFPMAFLKAVAFAYVGWSVVITFGSAGWLIRLLLLFSDCASMPLLWWFWNKALVSDFDALVPASVAAVLTILGIGIVDYGVISPFLVSLSL